jgi:spore coat polysaccharide biosynthesis protein SpsF
MNTLTIIQARMSSSRLPGKVLMDIAGRPMLQRVVERALAAKSSDGVIIATTSDPSDDILEQFCQKQGYTCYRGSLSDVLDRYYQAALQSRADVIVRLTADCPLIDPRMIDLTVSAFLSLTLDQLFETIPASKALIPNNSSLFTVEFDFCANRLPPPWKRTLPIGLDIEVCSFAALERAWKEARELHQREHVMPYLYEGVTFSKQQNISKTGWYMDQGSTPRGFKIGLLNHHPDYGSLRWTVDTPADLEFVRQVYAHFIGEAPYDWQAVLALLQKQPQLSAINADIEHKSVYDVDQRLGKS